MVECWPGLCKILGLSLTTKEEKQNQQSHQCILLQFLSCLNPSQPPWPPFPLSSRLLDMFDFQNIMYLVLAGTSENVPAPAFDLPHALGSGCAHIQHFPSYWPCAHSLAWPLPPIQGSYQSSLPVFSVSGLTRLRPQRLNYENSRNPNPFPLYLRAASLSSGKQESPGPHLHITTPKVPFPYFPIQILAHRHSGSGNHIAWVCIQVLYLLTMWPWTKILSPQCPGFLMHKMRIIVLCGRMANYLTLASECWLQSYQERLGLLGKLQQMKLVCNDMVCNQLL